MSENYEHRAFFEMAPNKWIPIKEDEILNKNSGMKLNQKQSDRAVIWTLIFSLVCALILTLSLLHGHQKKNKVIDLTHDQYVKKILELEGDTE